MRDQGKVVVDDSVVGSALTSLGYDEEGLSPLERRYMARLRASPVPLARLARLLGETARALLDDVEPYLFRRGLVQTTLRGRVALPHLAKPDSRASLSGHPGRISPKSRVRPGRTASKAVENAVARGSSSATE